MDFQPYSCPKKKLVEAKRDGALVTFVELQCDVFIVNATAHENHGTPRSPHRCKGVQWT